ncbi:MAG: copper resistance protein NlpE [Alistipes sp.]
MKKIIIPVMALMLCACGGNTQNKNQIQTASESSDQVDTHNAQNALDYVGTYTGTFPAADCPGIETTLTLNEDQTYTLDQSYIERDAAFMTKGDYTVNDNLLTLIEPTMKTYFKVEENRLRRLDADQKPIDGELAEMYILTKTLK